MSGEEHEAKTETAIEEEKIEFISKEEMLRLLLVEDEDFKDEGRDVYMDDVIDMIRKDLGTSEKEDSNE